MKKCFIFSLKCASYEYKMALIAAESFNDACKILIEAHSQSEDIYIKDYNFNPKEHTYTNYKGENVKTNSISGIVDATDSIDGLFGWFDYLEIMAPVTQNYLFMDGHEG